MDVTRVAHICIAVASVSWHWSLSTVPSDAPLLLLANEFFDALPVHQFQYSEKGWCERLVEVSMCDGMGWHGMASDGMWSCHWMGVNGMCCDVSV